MPMTVPELNSEIRRLFDEAETIYKKYGGVLTADVNAEDYRRIEAIKPDILAKEAERDALTEAEGTRSFFADGLKRYGQPAVPHTQPSPERRPRSVGEVVATSSQYKTLLSSGGLSHQIPPLNVPLGADWSLVEAAKNVGRDIKALVTSSDTSGGGFVLPDRLTGWTELARVELGFLDVLPTIQTTSDLVEWVEQTTRTNNAAAVAEATATSGTSGEKPESAVAWAVQQRGVETIATWIPTTKRILADAPLLRSAIDDELMYLVREELEEQTITGNGTTPNLLGINNWPNIQTGAAGANPADAIFNAAMSVRFVGGVPATVAVLNQAGFAALRLMRENAASGTQGGYLFGSPNQPGPMTIFGLTVALAQAVPANTAFVLNATATTIALVEREAANVTTGWIDRQFVRNMLTLLAELRALLIVRRPKGIFKLTGMP
jgi:HK97 family phage major capsid protein